jgi:hypothetical protein
LRPANGRVAPPTSTAITGCARSSKCAFQCALSRASRCWSTRINGNDTPTTFGPSGTWNCADTTISAKFCGCRFGRPNNTMPVRLPDCRRIHSAAMAGRRPIVMTRSGQGGVNASDCVLST